MTQANIAVAQTAVASASAELFGKPVSEVEASLVEIGFQSQKAENLMAQGEQARDICDANLALALMIPLQRLEVHLTPLRPLQFQPCKHYGNL